MDGDGGVSDGDGKMKGPWAVTGVLAGLGRMTGIPRALSRFGFITSIFTVSRFNIEGCLLAVASVFP